MIAKEHIYKSPKDAIKKQKELSKKLGYIPNILKVTNRTTTKAVYKVIEPTMSQRIMVKK